jgi:hypothetical protein
MRLLFAKNNGVLLPASREARVFVGTLKKDEGAGMDLQVVSDIGFHKKLIALLELAFEHWEPNDDRRIDGISLRKDFEQFRKKVMVLAGYYDEYWNAAGEVRLDARSISFEKCDNLKRAQLYRAVLEVVWTRILQPTGYRSRDHAEAVAAAFMEFE